MADSASGLPLSLYLATVSLNEGPSFLRAAAWHWKHSLFFISASAAATSGACASAPPADTSINEAESASTVRTLPKAAVIVIVVTSGSLESLVVLLPDNRRILPERKVLVHDPAGVESAADELLFQCARHRRRPADHDRVVVDRPGR